jgi:hypothetical protein
MVYFTLCASRLHMVRDAVRDAEGLTRGIGRAGPPVILYIVGATGGRFWCPDCEAKHQQMHEALSQKSRTDSAIVVEIQVDQETYESNHCSLRLHAQIAPHLRDQGVPCVISWPSVDSFLDNETGAAGGTHVDSE